MQGKPLKDVPSDECITMEGKLIISIIAVVFIAAGVNTESDSSCYALRLCAAQRQKKCQYNRNTANYLSTAAEIRFVHTGRHHLLMWSILVIHYYFYDYEKNITSLACASAQISTLHRDQERKFSGKGRETGCDKPCVLFGLNQKHYGKEKITEALKAFII
jgi:hypothetical protein